MQEINQQIEEKFILKSITDTLTGKKLFQITVPVKWSHRTIWDRLLGRPIEKYRTFEIWPCIVANQYRIAGHAALLQEALYDDQSLNIKFLADNQAKIAYVVASAIQNNHLEPDPELIQFIERNFDYEDLYTALRASFTHLGMQAFTNSIVLLRGTVNILKPETSPIDGIE